MYVKEALIQSDDNGWMDKEFLSDVINLSSPTLTTLLNRRGPVLQMYFRAAATTLRITRLKMKQNNSYVCHTFDVKYGLLQVAVALMTMAMATLPLTQVINLFTLLDTSVRVYFTFLGSYDNASCSLLFWLTTVKYNFLIHVRILV